MTINLTRHHFQIHLFWKIMFWSHMQDAAAPDGLDKFGRRSFLLSTASKQGVYLMTKQKVLKTSFGLSSESLGLNPVRRRKGTWMVDPEPLGFWTSLLMDRVRIIHTVTKKFVIFNICSNLIKLSFSLLCPCHAFHCLVYCAFYRKASCCYRFTEWSFRFSRLIRLLKRSCPFKLCKFWAHSLISILS